VFIPIITGNTNVVCRQNAQFIVLNQVIHFITTVVLKICFYFSNIFVMVDVNKLKCR
jgi:hypothetical protein